MREPTPTVPGGIQGAEPVLTLTLVLPLAESAFLAEFAARRGVPIASVVETLLGFMRLGEDGTVSMGPVHIGSEQDDPQVPAWAAEALADPGVMTRRNAMPIMVLPGCRSSDHTRGRGEAG